MAFVVGALFLRKLTADSRVPSGGGLGIAGASAIEITLVVSVVFCVLSYDGVWPRACFVLLFIGLMFCLAHNRGVISRILSLRPFAAFGHIEMEFYLLRQPVIRIVLTTLALFGVVGAKKVTAIALVLTIVPSWLFTLLRRVAYVQKESS